jgi:MFS family permease
LAILGSGMIADRIGARDPRRRLWLIAGVLLVATPTVILGCVLPQPFALPVFLAHLVITSVWLGPATATAQNLAHPRMRATVAAILFVTMGVVGVGIGPVFTGVISDVWSTHFGAEGLRVALIVTTLLGFWSALHFYLATRTLVGDLARVPGA